MTMEPPTISDQERTRSSVQLHFVIGLVSRQFLMAVGRARFRRPPTPAGGACGRTTLTRDGGRPSSAPRKGPRTRAAEPDLTARPRIRLASGHLGPCRRDDLLWMRRN